MDQHRSGSAHPSSTARLLTSARQRLRGQGGKVLISLGLKGVAAVLGFLLSWVVARLYGPVGVGIYAVAVTTATLLGNLAVMGQDLVMLRQVAGDLKVGRPDLARGVVAAASRIALLAALVAAAVFAALHGVLARAIDQPGAAPALLAVAPAIVAIAMMRMSSFALRATGSIVASQSLEGPLTSGLGVLLLLAGWALLPAPPLWVPPLGYTLAMATTALVGWTLFRRAAAGWPAGAPAAGGAMLRAGLPIMVSVVANFATEWSATFATSTFAGAAAAGQFRICMQITQVMMLVNAAFDAILGPQYAGAWRVRDRARIARLTRLAIAAMLALVAPLLLLVLVAPEWLLGLFGPRFVAAAPLLQLLCLGQALALATGPVGSILTMAGHGRGILSSSLAGLAVLLVLCVTAVPAFGALGGGMAVVGALMARRLVAGWVVRHRLGIRIFGANPPPAVD